MLAIESSDIEAQSNERIAEAGSIGARIIRPYVKQLLCCHDRFCSSFEVAPVAWASMDFVMQAQR